MRKIMNCIGYYINKFKTKTTMTKQKQEALARLDAIEKEQKELRKIIEAPEVKAKPTTLKEACKNQGVDYDDFLEECRKLPRDESGYKKLKIIIKDVRGDWKPTLNNNWYYPYFERTPSGFVCHGWYLVRAYDGSFGSALVLENSEDAIYVGKTFEAEYNEYYNVK